MGGAIYYSIYRAEKKEEQAKEFIAGALWVLIVSSILLTISVFLLNSPLLRLLGAKGDLLTLGEEYIAVIALGAALQCLLSTVRHGETIDNNQRDIRGHSKSKGRNPDFNNGRCHLSKF